MRELKFRMWDKVNNKFISPFRFEWNDYYKNTGMVVLDFHGKIRIADYSSGNGDNSADSVYLEVDNPDNYVVQQYTGLNDKNGNNIYEGDIIKETHFEDWKDETGYDYFGVVKHVVYTDKTNGHQVSRYSSFPKLEEMAGYAGNPISVKCELVGNIFGFPCRPDHNGECLICDCWLTDCPLKNLVKRDKAKKVE